MSRKIEETIKSISEVKAELTKRETEETRRSVIEAIVELTDAEENNRFTLEQIRELIGGTRRREGIDATGYSKREIREVVEQLSREGILKKHLKGYSIINQTFDKAYARDILEVY